MRHAPAERRNRKTALVRGLFGRGLSRSDILELFRLIDWLMELPPPYQDQFEQEISTMEEQSEIPLLSRMEERAIIRGREQGSLQALREAVSVILDSRFWGGAGAGATGEDQCRGLQSVGAAAFRLLVRRIAATARAERQGTGSGS